jgi:hypothetical protein
MLSVNYIANYLTKEQKEVSNDKYILKNFEVNNENENIVKNKIKLHNDEKKNFYINLYDCFEPFFEKDLFGLNSNNETITNTITSTKKSINKNYIFTFFSSIFGIGDENYYLFSEDEKILAIKNLIHQLDKDILSKNYYKEFNYDKNKFFSKEKILTALKDAFHLRVNENFYILIKYVVDYLGINLVLFELKNKEIINHFKIISTKYTNSYNKYLPHYFVIREDDEFKPIMIKNKLYKNYVTMEDNYKIVEQLDTIKISKMCITNNTTNNEELAKIKKMKIDELREYCISKNINILKKSEKTNKEIKKTKDELLNELQEMNK